MKNHQLYNKKSFNEFLQDIAKVGVACGDVGEKYAIIGARTNARWWLTPVTKGGRCAAVGLAMFQPISRSANIAKKWLNIIARFISHKIWARHHLFLKGVPEFISIFNRKDLCCAYFTGTDGPHRKTAIQIMTLSGDILGYAKISQKPHVIKYIANESKILAEISILNISSAEVPKVLSSCIENEFAFLMTDSLKSDNYRTLKKIEECHRKFLRELACKTGKIGVTRLLSNLNDDICFIEQRVSDSWNNVIKNGYNIVLRYATLLPTALAHGDFTPWNSFVTDGKLYVFDWEYSEKEWPLGYDVIHFLLSVEPAEYFNTSEAIELIAKEIVLIYTDINYKIVYYIILLSLILHAVFYLKREFEFSKKEKIDWPEGEKRKELIGKLLNNINNNNLCYQTGIK